MSKLTNWLCRKSRHKLRICKPCKGIKAFEKEVSKAEPADYDKLSSEVKKYK